jgi:hypothetical protein
MYDEREKERERVRNALAELANRPSKPPRIETVRLTIVGTSPLISHAWSHPAYRRYYTPLPERCKECTGREFFKTKRCPMGWTPRENGECS